MYVFVFFFFYARLFNACVSFLLRFFSCKSANDDIQALASLDELESVHTISDFLSITANPVLSSLQGLRSLVQTGFVVTISDFCPIALGSLPVNQTFVDARFFCDVSFPSLDV